MEMKALSYLCICQQSWQRQKRRDTKGMAKPTLLPITFVLYNYTPYMWREYLAEKHNKN